MPCHGFYFASAQSMHGSSAFWLTCSRRKHSVSQLHDCCCIIVAWLLLHDDFCMIVVAWSLWHDQCEKESIGMSLPLYLILVTYLYWYHYTCCVVVPSIFIYWFITYKVIKWLMMRNICHAEIRAKLWIFSFCTLFNSLSLNPVNDYWLMKTMDIWCSSNV